MSLVDNDNNNYYYYYIIETEKQILSHNRLTDRKKDRVSFHFHFCGFLTSKNKINIKDVVKFAAKQKWKWAGHVARLNDNRWTKRITDWQPRYRKRSRGRQVKRWRDDIVQMKGITWGRDAGQRDDWRRDAEGYILQWMDGASVNRCERPLQQLAYVADGCQD